MSSFNGVRREVFDLADFLDHVQSPSVAAPEYVRGSGRDGNWYGVNHKDNKPGESAGQQVIRLAREGWPKGARLLEQVVASTDTPRAQNIRRRPIWRDQGDEINMQRVYSGNLDRAWMGMSKRIGQGPARVRILVDSLASGGLDADTMRWRGVAAMRLADTLTTAGYSVQVESGFSGNSGGRVLRVIVKAYTTPLDMETLAATTALPGFFRALGHAWAGGGMSITQIRPEDAHDPHDAAEVFVIPQSIRDAATASAEVDRVLAALQPQVLDSACND